MDIWIKNIKEIRIDTGYGAGHIHEVPAPIPAKLVQTGDRFDVVFDENFSAFGEVISDGKETSDKILLIQGLTVGLLTSLRDRDMIWPRGQEQTIPGQ